MRRASILCAVACFFAVTFAHITAAQKILNVAGNWDVTVKMPDKDVSEHWVFQQNGPKITGTAKGDKGELPVSGVVDGVFLRVAVKDGDVENRVRATIDNDSLDGSILIGKTEYLWSAKRVK